MTQSKKYLQIQQILLTNQSLKNMINLIKTISDKYINFDDNSFFQSQHFTFLVNEINKLKLPELSQIISQQLLEPQEIIALPIKIQTKFTLFFVLVPTNLKFDWHNHPKMTGISKCIHGTFEITALNITEFQQLSPHTYHYPLDKMRIQELRSDGPLTVSTIQPTNFNIHRIQAKRFSAFFDLLMPDYPENTCAFYRNVTINQEENSLVIQRLKQSSENIKGWDVYLEELIKKQKIMIKNYIIQ